MKALQHQHEHPLEAEMERAQVPVLGYLVRLTGNLAEARDLLQMTNLTAWEKRADYEPDSNVVAWLRAIAHNHYRNAVRRWRNSQTVPLLDSDLEQMIETRHEEREQEESRKRRLLQICLAKLPDRQREAVEGYYLSGQSLEDLGSEAGRKPNAMAQLLHRARRNLIDCVRQESHQQLDHDNLSEFP
ncbi:MAG: sigma-70 family RNA polymerase sigma factor [Verrucomicrobiales bacterium]|nr:sigma-70 family RNA polymerase sigma factor [Verrucomicrobiales bacterium]